jgi:MFS transporter, AAHS family, vanillate permease
MTADPRVLLRYGPMTMVQFMVVAVCTALNAVDGFDVLAMSFAAPLVQKEFAIDAETLGILLSAGLAGMCIGSLTLSPVADVIGRRRVVLLCTAIISIGMFASALANSAWELTLFRLLTGLGIGGILSSGNTLLSEYSPDRWRNTSISAMVVGYSVGALLGGSISAYLIGVFGWRSAFVFGSATSTLILPLVWAYVPESLDFMLSGKSANALAEVNVLLMRLGRPAVDALPPPVHEENTRAVWGVFEPRFLKGTILICLSFFMLMLSFYFVLSWTPKNLVDLGFTVRQGIFASVLLNAGGIGGGMLFGYCADKSAARSLAPYLFVGLFLFIVIYGALHAGLVPVMAGALIVGVFMIAAMASLYAIVPTIYPPRVRNTGTGLAIGIGRLGAVAGPYLGGVLIQHGWERLAYYSVLAIPVLVSALAVRHIPLFGEREIAARPVLAPHLRPSD